MPGAKIGYIRVSTVDQNTERQLSGMTLDKVFEDMASGKDSNRPQLRACLEYCREGDTLFVHSIDRLARNLHDLLRLIEHLSNKGVTVRFYKENLIFLGSGSDPVHTLMLQIIGACAQFERALLKERQREGIALAKKEGRLLGRPFKLTEAQIRQIQTRAFQGENRLSLAKEYGISRTTIYRILKKITNNPSRPG